MQSDITAVISISKPRISYFWSCFLPVNRLLFSNKVLIDFLENGNASKFRSPSASVAISLPSQDSENLGGKVIFVLYEPWISSITLHSFFSYNFLFSLCDIFLPVKTNLKWTVCVLHHLSQGTAVLCVISIVGFLHSPSALSVPGLEELCSLAWHNIISPTLQEDREILFVLAPASSLI